MTYQYTEQNLLEVPNTYMYSPYEGRIFLETYISSREDKLIGFEKSVDLYVPEAARTIVSALRNWVLTNASPHRRSQCNTYCDFSVADIPGSDQAPPSAQILFDSINNIDTLELLCSLLHEQREYRLKKSTEVIWHKLIQKYEVTKKIYDCYGAKLKKGTGSYNNTNLYVLLSLSCAIHYIHSGSLVALNAMLKLNDTLCSLTPVELDASSCLSRNLLVCIELSFVDGLVNGD